MAKRNAFVEAKAAATVEKKKPTKVETVFEIPVDHELQGDLRVYLEEETGIDEAETRCAALKERLTEFATGEWMRYLLENKGKPPGVVRVTGIEGRSVTFVAKEEKLPALEETIVSLKEALPDIEIDELVHEDLSLEFDAKLLTLPTIRGVTRGKPETVFDWLGERMAKVLADGVKAGVITKDQADGLIKAKSKRVIVAGYLDMIAAEADGSRKRLEAAFDAIGLPKRHVQP